MKDNWNKGDPYEYFMGRWSRLMAPLFLEWLDFPLTRSWLDVGCGTGALSEAICLRQHPSSVTGIDPSVGFLEKARERTGSKALFKAGDASHIPLADHVVDIAVSGLALNFFPDVILALDEMKRVVKPNGTIAAYVWDYSGRMDFLRLFWDAASALDTAARQLDEGIRFPVANTAWLESIFKGAGLLKIESKLLDINIVFENFEDYWNPFLGGQGPAPAYLASLNEASQRELKNAIIKKIPVQADGTIQLLARAIGIMGVTSQYA